MKAQDVLLLLKLLSGPPSLSQIKRLSDVPVLSQKELSDSLGLSQAEVSQSLRRLKSSHLIDEKRAVKRRSALEFLLYGLKYVFPASYGPVSLGMPTAHSHPSLKFIHHDANSSLENYVWPDPQGSVRGQSLRPLYDSVPAAAKKDPDLYELLSLIDMIRVGRARESQAAIQKLQEKLASNE
ncbi:MAG: winged helix-turn-helix transcriptional regulator [Bdellovibrionaceae bacterium]|nr:winged helix-turn-helix transcriptional regulator [Pseudobdellovibrionaceae bacterium]MBX3032317.1 winged helix-turn-helix transcriptional regulator [Pseudobdellovibrionaceae bacterium]